MNGAGRMQAEGMQAGRIHEAARLQQQARFARIQASHFEGIVADALREEDQRRYCEGSCLKNCPVTLAGRAVCRTVALQRDARLQGVASA
jgi:hypothetical protein